MLTELCQELKNWFCTESDVHAGEYTISSGTIYAGEYTISGGILSPSDFLTAGQYFRVVGSVFNDGVHKMYVGQSPTLKDETFTGAIWAMRVPQAIIDLDESITDFLTKNADALSSPYQSES